MSALWAPSPDAADAGGRPRALRRRPGLKVVPRPPARMARIPFIAVLIALFGVGMAGLLMLNTTLQNQAFEARGLSRQANELVYGQAELESAISRRSAPQELARRASALGMRPNPHPAFVVVPSGKVIGKPTRVVRTGSPVRWWSRRRRRWPKARAAAEAEAEGGRAAQRRPRGKPQRSSCAAARPARTQQPAGRRGRNEAAGRRPTRPRAEGGGCEQAAPERAAAAAARPHPAASRLRAARRAQGRRQRSPTARQRSVTLRPARRSPSQAVHRRRESAPSRRRREAPIRIPLAAHGPPAARRAGRHRHRPVAVRGSAACSCRASTPRRTRPCRPRPWSGSCRCCPPGASSPTATAVLLAATEPAVAVTADPTSDPQAGRTSSPT